MFSKSCLIVCLTIFLATRYLQGKVVKRSDDQSLQALQTIVQQQATVLAALEADTASSKNQINGLLNSVNSLTSRLTAMSKSVAFTVYFSHDDPDQGVAFGSDPILRFDAVMTNIGNGYNPMAGIFTAPVTGTYAFFLTEMAPDKRGPIMLQIRKEGVILDQVWAPGSQDVDDQGGTSLITTHMNKGERVWVTHSLGDAIRGSYNTIFTGYLIMVEM